MNGGCAMGLPTPVQWPDNAVAFLLLGGNDYFCGHMNAREYLTTSQDHVPHANATTAILLVNEMTHMPQSELLDTILLHMVHAATSWKATGWAPLDSFSKIIRNLKRGGWSGKLAYRT